MPIVPYACIDHNIGYACLLDNFNKMMKAIETHALIWEPEWSPAQNKPPYQGEHSPGPTTGVTPHLSQYNQDDVIKWKHSPHYWSFVRGTHWSDQRKPQSSMSLAFVRGIHRSPVDSPHKGQWHRALRFSLIYAWTNDWANNRDAGNFRCHGTHYDATVMIMTLKGMNTTVGI